MRILGFELSRTKATPAALSSADANRGWRRIISEPFTGAWQANKEVRIEDVLVFPAAFRCISLIASDIAKVRLRLVEFGQNVWTEVENSAFSPVLRRPNRYQNRIQFITSWMLSKLIHGNTYILKERDNRNVVVALYVLDPLRVRVLVAPDGSVWYRLSRDDLSGIKEEDSEILVPAREIIHDRSDTFYHPLIGLSPLHAAGRTAMQGLNIQNFSSNFFENNARPGGIITAPGEIDEPDVERLKAAFEANYGGANVGRIAVLGSGLTFSPMTLSAVDADLINQLRWSAETVCSVFGVPAYKAGVGPAPTYDNVAAMNQSYYEDCLQRHIEDIEACLDDGLELPKPYGTEFDLDDLLRMDAGTQIKMLKEGVTGALYHPNEARRKLGLKPTKGGDQAFLQQQNFSLEALAKRDAKEDPFASGSGTAPAQPDPTEPEAEPATPEERARSITNTIQLLRKAQSSVRHSA